MSDISLNKNSSFADTQALAAWLNDPLLQERADELHEMVRSSSLQAAPTPQQTLALDIKRAWVKGYGDDVTLWPQRLKNSLATMNAGVGFSNFSANLTSAFQDLRLEDTTVAAFDEGVAIIRSSSLQAAPGGFNWRNLKVATPEESGLIPESAARAGLSFISNPLALVVPIWLGGIAGRAVAGLTANAGRALSLADNAVAGLATLFGLTGEAAGFVATSHVIAPARQRVSGGSASEAIPSPQCNSLDCYALRARNDILTEIAASAAFFASLKLFGFAGQALGSMLAVSETGIALAKLTQHASSITGLAFTEGIQEAAGIAPKSGEDMWTRLVRATFLHGAITSINGLARLEPSGTPVTVTAKGIESALRQFVDIRQPLFQTEGSQASDFILFADNTPKLRSLQGGRAGGNIEGPSAKDVLADTVRLAVGSPHDRNAQTDNLIALITEWAGRFRLRKWNIDAFRQNQALMQVPPPLVDTLVRETENIWPGGLMLLEELGILPEEFKVPITEIRRKDGPVKDMTVESFKQRALGQIDGILDSFRVFYESGHQGAQPPDAQKAQLKDRLLNMPSTLVEALDRVSYFHFDKLADILGINL